MIRLHKQVTACSQNPQFPQSYASFVSFESVGERRLLLLRRGRQLETVTLFWNVAGVVILAVAATAARSIALAGFGLDSVIEIGASTVVLWELAEVSQTRQQTALRMIGIAFIALSIYLAVQSTIILVIGFRPHHSPLGIVWTSITASVMFTLATGKSRVGTALKNPVLKAEGRVTMIDGVLASAVTIGLVLNVVFNWWWADPVAGYVILYYCVREARTSLQH
jgi:divalent metal cation (Fe/Co/Zn/Cd) transporter